MPARVRRPARHDERAHPGGERRGEYDGDKRDERAARSRAARRRNGGPRHWKLDTPSILACLGLKPTLKRGALLAAANWPLIIVQFIADSIFKIALAVPVIGGVLMVGLMLGGDVSDLMAGDLRERVTGVAAELLATPVALVLFLLAFGVVLIGGSALVFLVKGGTVTVLALAERGAGPIEDGTVDLDLVARARRFSIERFIEGCERLFRRYFRLGLSLIVVYGVTGGAYLLVVLGGYRFAGNPGMFVGWTVVATLFSGALLVWITIVNLFYLLLQMIIAVDDVSVRTAFGRVIHFLGGAFREVAGVFGVVLLLVLAATAVSIVAAAGLGLIAFVPFASVIVVPLQLVAWLLRGLIFEFIGLTALGAYLTRYRRFAGHAPAHPQWIRTA
ncbi:MAG: hypothetical protein HYU53_18270 [Acidobacteria bacterium]|nr:hypothetical protein [Acidobacteriota bacterium]